jgi:hypothetical protein
MYTVEIRDSESNAFLDELGPFRTKEAAIKAAEKNLEGLSPEEQFYTEYVIIVPQSA